MTADSVYGNVFALAVSLENPEVTLGKKFDFRVEQDIRGCRHYDGGHVNFIYGLKRAYWESDSLDVFLAEKIRRERRFAIFTDRQPVHFGYVSNFIHTIGVDEISAKIQFMGSGSPINGKEKLNLSEGTFSAMAVNQSDPSVVYISKNTTVSIEREYKTVDVPLYFPNCVTETFQVKEDLGTHRVKFSMLAGVKKEEEVRVLSRTHYVVVGGCVIEAEIGHTMVVREFDGEHVLVSLEFEAAGVTIEDQ